MRNPLVKAPHNVFVINDIDIRRIEGRAYEQWGTFDELIISRLDTTKIEGLE